MLHDAVKNRSVNDVKKLLEIDATNEIINSLTDNGGSALHMAVIANNIEKCRLLCQHPYIDVNRQGILVNYGTNLDPAIFTTDLNNWWTIPGLPSYTAG